MAQQAIVVYVSRDGGEINDLSNLVSELVVELNWVGLLNGQEVPIKVRLSDVDEGLEEDLRIIRKYNDDNDEEN